MSGGLKFLKLLSKKNFETLERALDPDAESSDRFMGNKVIKDLVARGAEMLPRPRKPGPKKEKTTNSTDEELRRLIENVRGVMSISAKVSRLETLRSLSRLIAYASEVCTTYCFLTRSEYESLRLYFCRLKELADPQDVEIVSAIAPLYEKGSRRLQDVPTFGDLTSESGVFVEQRGSSARSSSKLEAEVFYELASRLEMVVPDLKVKSFQDYGLSRGGILRAGLARLHHLKHLLKLVELAIDGDIISEVHSQVQDAFMRDLNNGELYGQIDGVLHTALDRQGIHPLRRFTLETLDLGAKQFEEGEVYPGGHFGGIWLGESGDGIAESPPKKPRSRRGKSR